MLRKAFIWCFVAAILLPRIALAQATLTLKLSVLGKPLSGAAIRIDLPGRVVEATSNAHGKAVIANVPTGRFLLHIESPDTAPTTTYVVVKYDTSTLTLAIVLEAKTIATAIASPPLHVSRTYVNPSTPLGKLSSDLYDELNRLGGADVRTNALGQLTGISLEGRDPRLTTYSLDGGLLPSPQALLSLDPELLQSATVDTVSKPEVAFFTLSPTTWPTYTIKTVGGGFKTAKADVTVQGTTGTVGYVVEAETHANAGPLDNQLFRDASGLDYVHHDDRRGGGALAKITQQVGPASAITAEFAANASRGAFVVPYLLGSTPAGVGPGNFTATSGRYGEVEYDTHTAGWDIRFNALDLANEQADELQHRLIAGVPNPGSDGSSFQAQSDSLALIRTSNLGTLNINVGTSLLRSNAYTASSVTPTFDASLGNRARDTSGSVDLALHHGSIKDIKVSYNRYMGRPATLYFEGNARRENAAHLTWFSTIGYGSLAEPPSSAQTFGNPASATYDCQGNQIFAQAPNETVDVTHELYARAGITQTRPTGSFSAQAYAISDSGVGVSSATVPVEAFGGTIPTGYLASLLGDFASVGGCSPAPQPPTVFFQHDISGLRVAYEGLEISLSRHIGPHLIMQANLEYHRARLTAATRELLSAQSSPYIVGTQLPAVSPLSASVTFDWGLPDQRTEAIINALYTSRNNPNNLPAYTLITAGLERKLSPTTSLTLVATNLGHRFTDAFVSPRFAVPLATRSGAPLLLPAIPLAAPQLFLTLQTRIERAPF